MLEFFEGDIISGRYAVNDVRKGGMGIVYICYDEFAKETVAIKSFLFKDVDRFENISEDFIEEAKTWISIGKTRNVVEAYGIINLESDIGIIPHIVIEYIPGHPNYGESLYGWIHNSALSFELIWYISVHICGGMISIQKRLKNIGDFVHRDLKPQNVLFSNNGCIKISDFGLTKPLFKRGAIGSFPVSHICQDGSFSFGTINNICGTPPYMSPEQCTGDREIDQRSDIYSFGCILYEMCTNGYVFQVNTPKEFIESHLYRHHIPVQNVNPDVPLFFSKLIDQCLEKNPDRRPQSFTEINNYLVSELRENQLHRDFILFTMLGLSFYSDYPRTLPDWGLSRSAEALILGKAFGVDYLIKIGMINDVDQWDKIVQEKKNKNWFQKSFEKEKYDLENNVYELVKKGDFLLSLSKSANYEEKTNLLKSAIMHYKNALSEMPFESQILFRIGISQNDQAEMIEGNNQEEIDDLLKSSIMVFEDSIKRTIEPILVNFNDMLYLLPYHAIYHISVSQVFAGDYQGAVNTFDRLISFIDRSNISEYPDIINEIRLSAIIVDTLLNLPSFLPKISAQRTNL